MKTEKIVISFIAVAVGVLAAGVIFYIYQTTKIIPASKTKTVTIAPPTPTPNPAVFLSLEKPKNEEVSDTKTITVSGKTTSDAVIAIVTESADRVITSASNGNFSANITLDDGVNKIEITAIAPNGEEVKVIRTVTYSTESF